MSINAFVRLRALLPPAPVLLGKVVEIHDDDTSTVELPQALANSSVANGLATGVLLRVRGSSVPVDGNAFIRDGLIESRAPDGTAIEAVVGSVAAQPFGPARLSASSSAVPAQVATVGVAYSLDLSGYWLGGYPARLYSVAAGTLPTGLTLAANTGLLYGTVATAAAVRAITVQCEDSTHRVIALAPFNLSAA